MKILLLASIFFILLATAAWTQEAQPEEVKLSQEQAHQYFTVSLNNRVWELLGKDARTAVEDDEMIRAAYSSLYHWSVIGQPVNIQRGEWMVSHVWAHLDEAVPTLFHAKKCWQLTEEHKLNGFDLGYAHEALARAYACAGRGDEASDEYEKAVAVGKTIEEEEDAKIFFGDLEAGPWFGVE